MHLQVCEGEEKRESTRALARLASSAGRGEAMGAGARRASE
jgi:hypothetical protein